MRVGVYIDGFNLYYGGRSQLQGQAGWKWMDLRAIASAYCSWRASSITRVIYCTARVNDANDIEQTRRQDFFLRALIANRSVDLIEEGYYASWSKESALSDDPPGSRAPKTFRDPNGLETWSSGLRLRRAADGTMLATIRKREEKGSDVNVASHLLTDVLTGMVDAAIVISNDSDLALPIRVAREHVPVGLLNPGKNPLAGALKGQSTDGVGGHWWRRLDWTIVLANQMPATVAGVQRPSSW